ncbi:MAG: hypothetical protein KJ971_06055 [Firmicutes bacterium]|nr:hypothetical protein [Bacillota bacterium]
MGNAKNAGKTTVLNKLIDSFKEKIIGITSIGLDGEKIDQITRLPKPRIKVYPKMIVGTAKNCLEEITATYKILKETDIQTSIGKIVIIEIIEEGFCLVAGPSLISDMEKIILKLKEFQCEKIFIDGAFSRHTTAGLADATLFCVGANQANSIEEVIQDAMMSIQKFQLPQIEERFAFLDKYEHIASINQYGKVHILDESSTLIHPEQIISELDKNTKYLYIPNALGPKIIHALINNRNEIKIHLILQTPINLQANEKLLKHLFQLNQQIYVIHPIHLIAIMINPYSPKGYSFDKILFKELFMQKTTLPILNVLEESE